METRRELNVKEEAAKLTTLAKEHRDATSKGGNVGEKYANLRNALNSYSTQEQISIMNELRNGAIAVNGQQPANVSPNQYGLVRLVYSDVMSDRLVADARLHIQATQNGKSEEAAKISEDIKGFISKLPEDQLASLKENFEFFQKDKSLGLNASAMARQEYATKLVGEYIDSACQEKCINLDNNEGIVEADTSTAETPVEISSTEPALNDQPSTELQIETPTVKIQSNNLQNAVEDVPVQ